MDGLEDIIGAAEAHDEDTRDLIYHDLVERLVDQGFVRTLNFYDTYEEMLLLMRPRITSLGTGSRTFDLLEDVLGYLAEGKQCADPNKISYLDHRTASLAWAVAAKELEGVTVTEGCNDHLLSLGRSLDRDGDQDLAGYEASLHALHLLDACARIVRKEDLAGPERASLRMLRLENAYLRQYAAHRFLMESCGLLGFGHYSA